MKLLIILNSNNPETAWNALRLGNAAMGAEHEVSVFLMGNGVEIEGIKNERFAVGDTLADLLKSKGNLYACGTCLKMRRQEGGACPASTMSQLVQLIAGADKVVSFS